jgi:glycine cleavage system H protein
MVPANLRYTKSHEWALLEGDIVTVGITKFAADQLTDITYVEVPKPGKALSAGQPCGNVETVKAVSDIYSPVDGTVTAGNEALASDSGPLASDPYGAGWLFKARVAGPQALAHLLTPQQYQAQIDAEAH